MPTISLRRQKCVGTLCFALGMFIDGTARRKIKAAAAGYVSPLSFHLAGHGLMIVTGTLFGVLVAPVPVLAARIGQTRLSWAGRQAKP